MKKYRVDLLDFYGGEFKEFWLKANALKYVKRNESVWLWVDLTNNWTKETTRLKSTETSDYYRNEQGRYIMKGSVGTATVTTTGKEVK